MRTETTTRTLYTFSELSDAAKLNAIENLYTINVDYDWWESTYEDAANIGFRITGFDTDRGNYLTGDFVDSPSISAEKIVKEHGEDCGTTRIAKHYLQTIADINADLSVSESVADDLIEDAADEFSDNLREEYLSILRREYEYQTSSEQVIESIEANEYEFDENGKLA